MCYCFYRQNFFSLQCTCRVLVTFVTFGSSQQLLWPLSAKSLQVTLQKYRCLVTYIPLHETIFRLDSYVILVVPKAITTRRIPTFLDIPLFEELREMCYQQWHNMVKSCQRIACHFKFLSKLNFDAFCQRLQTLQSIVFIPWTASFITEG